MASTLYDLLKPKPIKDLVRIGSDFDGGYFIKQSTIHQSKVLIGLGVFINWEFETEFNNINKNNLHTYLLDASVSPQFYKTYFIKAIAKFGYYSIKQPLDIAFFFKKYIVNSIGLSKKWNQFFASNKATFIQKFLSNKNDNLYTSPTELFNKILSKNELTENSVFVKMDIEGSEYDVLNEFEKYYIYINCFAIEWHNVDERKEQFIHLVTQLQQAYDIVFVHNNNYAKMIDENFAASMEITFVKRNLIVESDNVKVNYKQLYSNKNTICNPTAKDIQPTY